MANQDAAFGFKPSRSLVGGSIRNNVYKIAANYGTSIFSGQTVEAQAAGGIELRLGAASGLELRGPAAGGLELRGGVAKQ